jgi:hypothetical protein
VIDDPNRLSSAEVDHLKLRCSHWASINTARDVGVSELELLRAMIGLQAALVVAKVRPTLAKLFAEAAQS